VTGSVEAALRALGVRCAVERRGALAVLTPARDDRTLERGEVRRDVLAVLRAHGFTHAAVEVADEDDRG
jgi:hypothetical protein